MLWFVRYGRALNRRALVMASFGAAMLVVLAVHVVSGLFAHPFGVQSLAYSEIALGATARVADQIFRAIDA
jgi:hypothetical protein